MGQNSDDLEHVYGAASPEESRQAYDKWSSNYDEDNLSNGFWLPMLAAGCLARHIGQESGPLLDAGCGTGLVGKSLAIMGYGPITGCDLSPEMVGVAEKTGAYSGFEIANMGESLPFADDAFAGFSCIGSFGPGHAPPTSLIHLARVIRPGGIGVFNLIEASYDEQGFPPIMDELTKTKKWRMREKSPAFPAFLLSEPDLLTRIYVVEML